MKLEGAWDENIYRCDRERKKERKNERRKERVPSSVVEKSSNESQIQGAKMS